MPLTAVNFHYVGMPDHPHPGINSLSPEEFAAILERIGRDFRFASLAEVTGWIREGFFPETDHCLVTFDDGLRCQVEVALPVLQGLGVPAAFFVQTGPRAEGKAAATHKLHHLRATRGDRALDDALAAARSDGLLDASPADLDPALIARHYRYDTPEAAALKFFFNYHLDAAQAEHVLDVLFASCGIGESEFIDAFYLDRDQIRLLGSLQAVGSHGVSHRPFARLDPETARTELTASRRALEAWSGAEVTMISYPFGNEKAVNREVGRLAEEAGYVGGFTMERARNRSVADPLLLARIDVLDVCDPGRLSFRSRYLTE